MSRPTLLTPELQAEICGYIENGNTFTRAYRLAGIGEKTFYQWKAQGEEDIKGEKETIHSQFTQAIKRAEEKFKAWNIQQIMNAGKNSRHWQACAWLLERKYPEEFSRREKLDITTKQNIMNVDIKLTKEDEDIFEDRVKSLLGQDVFDEKGVDKK